MKKTIVRALTVMAVTVTAIALFGCKNGLGSTVLKEVIESDEGQKDPESNPSSTEGMFADFDENAMFGGVSLSSYATGIKYVWPDSTDAVDEEGRMHIGLSGTIKFYNGGYYIPITLGDDYQIDKLEGDYTDYTYAGNTYLVRVRPISDVWNVVRGVVSKNGVDIKFLIPCDNVNFDGSGDSRPLVATYGDVSDYLESGSAEISNAVYGDEYVYISGDFKWKSADEMNRIYGDVVYTSLEDGYYLPVIFHDSFREFNFSYAPAFYYDLGLEGTQNGYLLYFGDDPDSAMIGYSLKFGIGGESDTYDVFISVSLPEDDSDVPASSEKTGIIIGDKVYAFADLEDEGILLSTNYGNYGIEKLDGTDVLRLSVGSYTSYTITFNSALDLSNKKIVVSYRTDAEYEDKSGNPQDKVILRKDANTASEVAYSFINKTTDWTSNELNVKNTDLSHAEYSSDGNITSLEDATAVKEIVLAPQDETGTVYIRSISIVDVD